MQRDRFETSVWQRLEPLTDWVSSQLTRQHAEFVHVRRHIHAHPELSGYERTTTAWLAEQLRTAGLDVRVARRETGLIADLSVGDVTPSTPLIAVRADIDALPLTDRKSVPYASTNPGVAHACGHDAHAAIALGTARLFARLGEELADVFPDFTARLRFILQPAEESCEGAAWMIEEGALEDVSAILGLHLEPQLPAGSVGIRYGVMTAYCDEVDIRIEGLGGHSARPFLTTDPVASSAQLISSLYALLPRTVDARDAAVFTIGRLRAGHAPNIIPDVVELAGTLRTTDPKTRAIKTQRIRTVCAAMATATENQIAVEFTKPLTAVVNDDAVTAVVESAAQQLLNDDNVHLIDQPSLGGEDFALYLERVPGCMFRLGCAGGDDWPPLHSPNFDIDERALTVGAGVFARSILLLAQTLGCS